MDPALAAATLCAMDAVAAAKALGAMDATTAGALLSEMTEEAALAAVRSMMAELDVKAAAAAVSAMDAAKAATLLASMDAESAAMLLAAMDPAAAAAALARMDSSTRNALLTQLAASDAHLAAAAAALDGLEPAMIAEALVAMGTSTAAATVAQMKATSAAAAIGEHMDTSVAKAMLEAVAALDAEAAADVLAAMSKDARKRLLEVLDVELGAQLLSLFKQDDRENTLSLLSLSLAKQLRSLAKARLRKRRVSEWHATSLADDAEVAAALRRMQEGGDADAEAFKARVAKADQDAVAAAAAVHSTRTAILSLQQEALLDQMDVTQLRTKMAAMAEQVDEFLRAAHDARGSTGESLKATLLLAASPVPAAPAAVCVSGYLEGLFNPATLSLVSTLDQHMTISQAALQFLHESHGVEGMVTEIGYDAELDMDGDGADDDDTYEDNVFVVRTKTLGFPEDTAVGRHLPVTAERTLLHVKAADTSAMSSYEDPTTAVRVEVWPLPLPETCPLRDFNTYGTLAVAGSEQALAACSVDLGFLTEGMVRLTTCMKQGLYAQIAHVSASIDTMPKGTSVSEEQAMLNKQKVELERLLSTKQMAKAMAEMKRYKKAPPAVVGVCCAVALLVNTDLQAVILPHLLASGGAIGGVSAGKIDLIWGAVRVELGAAPGQSTGCMMVSHMMSFMVGEAHAVEPMPAFLEVQRQLNASLSKEMLQRASSVTTLLFDWLAVVKCLIEHVRGERLLTPAPDSAA
jgi:Mg/Co/Ni transporter MgtE